ncbi:hypothetical protein [Bacillus sp. EB01]|uniref:hypothetical protein n=1 Tax=Bacillus sp. EB01 TaxID=1347086 RepID=UPI000A8675B6|nr:hypothetical protein [Bacillus sp. EB01]
MGDPTGARAEEIEKRGDCPAPTALLENAKNAFSSWMSMLPKHTLVGGLKQKSLFDFS